MGKRVRIIMHIICCAWGFLFAADKIYVFYPTTVRPQVVQQNLLKACLGAEIIVFARYNDFIAKTVLDSPAAVITKTIVLEQMGNYAIKLNGAFKGTTDEQYVILSVNEKLDPTMITAETMIGMIDFLGRKEMAAFISSFFTISPKLKRVTKIEDLLPLLTFNMSQGILISEREVSYFKQTSNLNFIVTALAKSKVGIVALGIKNNTTSPEILKAIKGLDNETNAMLGVDQWK
jgi:hypothetical protein